MQSVTDELYAAFRASKPSEIEGCPCCIDKKGICTLLAKPLEALTSRDLGRYAASAFLTVGDDTDFRYFLPRIFEISASDLGWYPTPEVVLGKLKLTKWNNWTKRQRVALASFIETWFDSAMSSADPHVLDSVLCGIGRAGIDPRPFLNRLEKNPAALKAVFELNSRDLYLSDRLRNPFWSDAKAAAAMVVAFLRSPEVEMKVSESD